MSRSPLSQPTRPAQIVVMARNAIEGKDIGRLYSAKRWHRKSRLNVKANYLVPLLCQFFETFDDVSIF
jgi:hypothetical protein